MHARSVGGVRRQPKKLQESYQADKRLRDENKTNFLLETGAAPRRRLDVGTYSVAGRDLHFSEVRFD